MLLALDPILVILLKFIDLIREKFTKKNEDGGDSYSDLPTDVENEIMYNFENGKNFSCYQVYNSLFFDNTICKNYRKGIKSIFIAISLFINIIILVSNMEKMLYTLLFFLNNLYLIFHTMDLYNEKLIRYTEKIQMDSLMEMEN